MSSATNSHGVFVVEGPRQTLSSVPTQAFPRDDPSQRIANHNPFEAYEELNLLRGRNTVLEQTLRDRDERLRMAQQEQVQLALRLVVATETKKDKEAEKEKKPPIGFGFWSGIGRLILGGVLGQFLCAVCFLVTSHDPNACLRAFLLLSSYFAVFMYERLPGMGTWIMEHAERWKEQWRLDDEVGILKMATEIKERRRQQEAAATKPADANLCLCSHCAALRQPRQAHAEKDSSIPVAK
jgi:hypothetical protein